MKSNLFRKIISLGILTSTAIFSIRANAVTIIPSGYEVEVIPTETFSLVQPDGLAVDKNDNIYVGINPFNGTSELLKITSSGDVSSLATFSSFTGGLTLNKNDQLFGSLFDGSIFTVNNGIESIFATGLPPTLEKLTSDDNNNLFVASFTGKTVSKVSPSGVVTTFASGLGGPFGVTFKDGLLFIGDNSNNGNGPGVIKEATSVGNLTDFFSPVIGRIIDLKASPVEDSLFVANQGPIVNFTQEPGEIDIVSNGQASTFATGFNEYPRALTFDSKGDLYVVDATNLYKISRVTVPEVGSPSGILALGALGLVSMLKRRQKSASGTADIK